MIRIKWYIDRGSGYTLSLLFQQYYTYDTRVVKKYSVNFWKSSESLDIARF